MSDLQNKTVIVTGGSRGIGFAVARALMAAGANVTITGRSEAHLSDARRLLNGAGPGGLEAMQADVRALPDVEGVVDATVARFGGLDVLVNNAGVGLFKSVADLTPDEWASVVETNLTGAFYMARCVIPRFRERGGGYIINISSLAGTNPFVGGGAYCASKAGLDAFSEVLMQEVRHENIRVSHIAPGSVATRFSGDEIRGAEWKLLPEDVAEVVLNLLGQHPRSLTSRVELRPSKPRK